MPSINVPVKLDMHFIHSPTREIQIYFHSYMANHVLTVATCHIQYTFLNLCQLFSRENGQNTPSPPFWYDTKMAIDGYKARKELIESVG